MAYVDPQQVVSPKDKLKNLRVVYDSGPDADRSWSVATMQWEEKSRVGLRWNGEEGEGGKGNPQSRGNPTWFIVPEEIADEVLRVAQKLREQEKDRLARGYRAMAADEEREEEASEWAEGLIADVS